MQFKKPVVVALTSATLLLLSGCNLGQQPEPTPDVGLIFTEAAQTVSAQFAEEQTQTALAAPSATQPPTATSIPTFAVGGSPVSPLTTPLSPLGTPLGTTSAIGTPTPLQALATQSGPLCNDAVWTGFETYPDGSEVKAGKVFEKIWGLQNTGTCTWDEGYALVHVAGDALGGKTEELIESWQFVDPGEDTTIAVDMVAPSSPGEYGGCWRMRGDNGYYFGTFLCVQIVVN